MLGVSVALLAAALYVFTLAPSVMPGDYAEFQFCAAILGVPHPTGYPLYIMLGKLFTLLPVGDVAYRVNLSSAVYMAGAVGVLYAVAVRLLRLAGMGRYWWAAGVGAALFAVSPTPWSMSLVARSYALNALLVGCVLFALASWRETRRARWFYAACLLIGLSIVHHGTTYVLLPAYGLYLLLVEWERRRPLTADHRPPTAGDEGRRTKDERRPILRLMSGVLCLLLGLSPLLFLVYRFLDGAPYYWGNPSSWKDFFNLLAGGPFHNQVFGYGVDLGTQLGRIAFGIGELSGQYTPLGILVGLAGLAVLWRVRWAEAGLLSLMMLANFAFAMNYSLVGYLYFIPTYLIWGIFITVGVGWLARLLVGAGLKPAPMVRFAILGVGAAAFVFALAYVTALRYPDIDQSGQTATRDKTLAILSAAPQGASLYLDWEELSAIRFYRLVYGMRRDLTLHSGDPSDWAKEVYCDLTNGTAAYVGNFAGAQPPLIARDFSLQPASIGWQVTGVTNSALYAAPPCGACATCR